MAVAAIRAADPQVACYLGGGRACIIHLTPAMHVAPATATLTLAVTFLRTHPLIPTPLHEASTGFSARAGPVRRSGSRGRYLAQSLHHRFRA